ncbi:MAG: YifB family Mg chelatase-like AAA ATPase [Candidatus Liptonbacteria bacterium]|nr:YifB family Mg chelatase-like AAA ATPase [Candidatus Liptonbacteria bacterium]
MQKSIAKVYSAELEGINAKLIEVEVDLNVGLHSFNIVGLADKALNEARERVNSALKNSGTKPPNRENRKVTVNLAPADVKKTGSQYDIAIALGYLLATKQIGEFETSDKIFIGELGLDGWMRRVNGSLNIAEMARARGFKYLFLPKENAAEAAVIKDIEVIPIESLEDAIGILEKKKSAVAEIFRQHEKSPDDDISFADFSEVKGQENAKRAMTIAASGGHNLLMIGPPGVGKSLLAQAMVGILPELEIGEAIEITKIYSAAGANESGLMRKRPFRSPHQTASVVAVIGGGSQPKPGEISLAHLGVLFLDELPEFQKNILESLRQPLESGKVHVARAKGTLTFPARFTLIAAMNPCPCGFYGDAEKECRCSAYEVIRYQKKISGPLLDRIDLQIKVPQVKVGELRGNKTNGPSSQSIKKKVEETRNVQLERLKKSRIRTNAEMSSKQAEQFANLDFSGEKFLETLGRTRLSPRGYYRLLKTARTIADLDKKEKTSAENLAEAFSYRLREEI